MTIYVITSTFQVGGRVYQRGDTTDGEGIPTAQAKAYLVPEGKKTRGPVQYKTVKPQSPRVLQDQEPEDQEPPLETQDPEPCVDLVQLVDDRSLPTLAERGIVTIDQFKDALINDLGKLTSIPYLTPARLATAATRLGVDL